MFKHHVFLLLCICLSFFSSLKASTTQDSSSFKPSGKVIARAFLDYSIRLDEPSSTMGFDITRALLGYNYKFSNSLQGQVVIDGASGKSSDGSLEVYLRNAFINWNHDKWNINGGLIGLLQYKTQEQYWKYRYVLKSYQDLNKMAPSVDLGFSVEYQLAPLVTVDLSITNGEGNKKIKQDDNMRYAGGISIYPIKNAVFRIYGDVYNQSQNYRDPIPTEALHPNYKSQYTLSLFAGYMNEIISCGVEYNHLYNKGYIGEKNYKGYSFYTSLKIKPKFNLFGRYDLTQSNAPSYVDKDWNNLDGQLMILGVEFQPLKQLKISPNIRNINPARSHSEQYFYINIDLNI